ncbi:hypothetical protein HBA12_03475 [Tenacibaculum mesophilum]|nr:hypothetical protein [Tenacibaculum mesophilum]KAF9659320.1 hypothetical protein HBA12_03475 [Tenacibaculum mesophilum]
MDKYTLTEDQKNALALHLSMKGLNDGQISDIFHRIKSESDYNKYLKYE